MRIIGVTQLGEAVGLYNGRSGATFLILVWISGFYTNRNREVLLSEAFWYLSLLSRAHRISIQVIERRGAAGRYKEVDAFARSFFMFYVHRIYKNSTCAGR